MNEPPVTSGAPRQQTSGGLWLRDDPAHTAASPPDGVRGTSVSGLMRAGIMFFLVMLMAVAWVSQIGQKHDAMNDYRQRVCHGYGVGCE